MVAGLCLLLVAALLPRAASLRAELTTRPPKVFYLFLADNRVEQEEIWSDYFSQGVRGTDYEAFIHCTDAGGCKRNIKHKDIFAQVATVPSQYCTNLLDPMLALLAAAYQASNPNDGGVDKFVYVSHNSLPVKPLKVAQLNLTKGNAGRALFPMGHFADCYKSHQWFVLSRSHASRLLAFAGQPVEKQHRSGCLRHDNKVPKLRTSGCHDEFWPMMAIFGRGASHSEPDPVLMRTVRDETVMWVDWANPEWSNHNQIIKNGGAGPAGPATIVKFTPAGLRNFASSSSLFVRKVNRSATYTDSRTTLREAFRRLVFRL